MDKSKIQKTIRSRRAVSPIIATLLLIAIAVIGGVMIYVFTQGFFGNSSITTSPGVDTITMTGYDMREIAPAGTCLAPTAGIVTHEGTLICHGDTTIDGKKTTSDAGAIFIKNVGQKEYTISKIEVNGRQLTPFVSTDALIDAGVGNYAVYAATDAADLTVSDAPSTKASVLPGQEGTIIVTFDGAGADANEALSGRTVGVKITSANGSVFNFNVVIGSKL